MKNTIQNEKKIIRKHFKKIRDEVVKRNDTIKSIDEFSKNLIDFDLFKKYPFLKEKEVKYLLT